MHSQSTRTHTPPSTQDFYPTPAPLIRRMLSCVDWRTVSAVLEPSAGKGDLADAIKRRLDSPERRYHRATLDCIEIDPHLQHILRGKGHTVVHDDFLSFRTVQRYDLIVANFPFSDGDSHLLHALDLLRAGGGQLVALVNAETIRNPYTRERQRLGAELDVLDAGITYLADQFTDAERPTDVEVALVTARVPAERQPGILLDSLRDAEDGPYHGTNHAEIVGTDPVQAMIARFNLECRAGARLIAEYDALKPLMLDRMSLVKGDTETEKYAKPIITLEVDGSPYGTDRINAYVRATRHKYWHALIGNDRFRAGYTSAILTTLDGKLADLRHKDFTAFNIRQLEAELRGELPGSIEDAILSLFDDLSRKYAYVDGTGNNIHYYTGWKTNRAHKINERVILPIDGYGAYSGGKLDAYRIAEKMADMVKVFQYLAGEPIDASGIAARAIAAANDADRFRNIDFHYFTATFYKKGTCHIRFTDQDLLDKFNVYGSQRKGWLPPSYGRRAYRDMDAEERAVVDEFQGEAAYTEVLIRRDYFFADVGVPQLGMGEAA